MSSPADRRREPIDLPKRPSDGPFFQQKMRAWQPILTVEQIALCYFILSLVFIPFGVAILVASDKVFETETLRYDDCGRLNTNCTISFNITEKVNGPVYLYYQLTKFHQNHRRYVQSRSDDQLRGNIVTDRATVDYCDPLAKPAGAKYTAREIYNPCGLVADSWFNDEFTLWEGTKAIPLRKDGISWNSDREKKFKQPNPYQGLPPPRYQELYPDRSSFNDFENEDFIVWMRTAGLPKFRKLYRIIDQDLSPGQYSFNIRNRFDVEMFEGEKAVLLSTMEWMGGQNKFLGWAYVGIAAIFFVFGVVFLWISIHPPRAIGDPSGLDWSGLQ
eukprot:TRINITY_DN10209_c0_g1_i1.p1 TRINITY_DN10209_c0_g1~~TRINITY_DN10209_c0_g1_i1.p1  ORF type:complete len:330 (-),score=50.74 TRINITY_DN10209_c0_g1_i1:166-1155(-)